MVVALGQAGEDDGADHSGVGQVDGEAAAVGCVVLQGEAVAGLHGFSVAFEDAAYGVGAAGEAADSVALAANPVGLPGGRAGGGAGEEDLSGEVDLDSGGGFEGEELVTEEVAELPGGVGVEGSEAEEVFLFGDDGEVGGGVCHVESII